MKSNVTATPKVENEASIEIHLFENPFAERSSRPSTFDTSSSYRLRVVSIVATGCATLIWHNNSGFSSLLLHARLDRRGGFSPGAARGSRPGSLACSRVIGLLPSAVR